MVLYVYLTDEFEKIHFELRLKERKAFRISAKFFVILEGGLVSQSSEMTERLRHQVPIKCWYLITKPNGITTTQFSHLSLNPGSFHVLKNWT
jgi:hypothetical protein